MSRMVAEGIIEYRDGHAHLLAGRRRSDARLVFPFPRGADGSRYERTLLPRQGSLWSYTVQRFQPKPPFNGGAPQAPFEPFAVGYVELPDALIVEARLATLRFEDLRIGMRMTLCLVPYRIDERGQQVHTYAFAPA